MGKLIQQEVSMGKHLSLLSRLVLVSCFVVGLLAGFFDGDCAWGNEGKESKVTSSGGYSHLQSKVKKKGVVKIMVKVRTADAAESLLQKRDAGDERLIISGAQEKVIREIESAGHKPVHVHTFKYIPYIAMTVDGAALDALLSSPDVISVEEDVPVPPVLDLSVPRVGATRLHAGNLTGEGIAVAVLDTGVDKYHPFLQGSVVSEACYSTNLPAYGVSSLCPWGVTSLVGEGSAMPYGGNCTLGECSHGTHVAGIIAGRDGISGSPGPGVAPRSGIIAIQVFSKFDSEDYCGAGKAPCVASWSSDQMKGLEHVYELRYSFSVAAVNMSLGGGIYASHCDTDPRKAYVDILRTAGIATVISSGNEYYCGAIAAPACISSAISVGATTDWDSVASYSNSASILSLLAPGSSINSSVPLADGGGYRSWNGTSMAAPHVAGAWALMKQSYPTATVSEILNSFTSTGLSVTDGGCSSVTKQRINVHEAFSSMTPRSMVASGSNLYVDYGRLDGTWMYNGTSWSRLSPGDPQSMVASGSLLYADYGPTGTWRYNGSSWTRISLADPQSMVASGSFLYADYGSTGIWVYGDSMWTALGFPSP